MTLSHFKKLSLKINQAIFFFLFFCGEGKITDILGSDNGVILTEDWW